jgi:hypothetical protein
MDSKRGQGISLNFIVIAIIAALVLVIVISFTVGGLGSSLSKIFQAGEQNEDSDIDLAKANCEGMCSSAEGVDSPADWNNADYCSKTYLFDGEQTHCWEAPISVSCSSTGDDLFDVVWECDEDVCGTCSEIICEAVDMSNAEDKATCKNLKYNSCLSKSKLVTDDDDVDQEVKLCKWAQ